MALSNAALSAKLDRIIATQALILAQLGTAPHVVAEPVIASVASPVAQPVAPARPHFGTSGAALKLLADAGDPDAMAEVAFRAAKRAAKA